jgi:glycosyltransferase involved in cell wall biosynthesis
MRVLIVISKNLSKNFIMKSLTFFNFIEKNIYSISYSKNSYLKELNINHLEIKKINNINYNEYNIIICDFSYYLNIYNIYNNRIIFNYNNVIKDTLNNYNTNNICINENDDNIKLHLSNNILYNVDEKKYYYLNNNVLFLIENKVIDKDILYINNKYIENIERSVEKYKINNTNIKIVEYENFPYKIVEYNHKYYKKYKNKIQEINIDNLKKKINNIIDFIYISNENISNFKVVDKLELHFTILILSYNNEKYTDLCLNSALNQNYENFDVIFINCNSTDSTREICEKYTNKYDNLTIIDEIDRIYQTENFLLGTLLSEKNTTIVSLDGDDWLINKNVLDLLNSVYFSTRCLLSYGSYIEFPYKNVRWAWKKRSLEELSEIRKNKFSLSHLRTWNKELFLNIKKESLKMNDKYPKMAGDVSVLLYMVEMYPEKCIFINNVMYVYNKTNILSDININGKKQIETAEYFFKKNKYSKIKINSILKLNDPLLYFINNLPISYFKFSMIERYLNYKKSKFICYHSYKIFKNSPYENKVHNYFFLKGDIIDSKNINLFFTNKKIDNYKYLKCNELYKKYYKIKNKNKLGIIILSCKKRLNKAIQKLNNFNKSNIDAVCKIFIGDINIEKTFEKDNIVYLNISDNYESLPLKIYHSTNWFLKNYNIDYIFKTDDDISINFKKIYRLFEDKISNKHIYCGNVACFKPYLDDWHFNKCENKELDNKKISIKYYGFYCSGGGYFVHKNILLQTLDRYLQIYLSEQIIAEDLLMGIVINEIDILPLHIPYFDKNILNWNEPDNVSCSFRSWRNLLSLEYKSIFKK